MNFIVLKTPKVLQGAGYSIPLQSGRVKFTSFLCMNGYFDGVSTI
jgi:hypothetical protein